MRKLFTVLLGLFFLALTACEKTSTPVENNLQKVRLQTDWFAQPEHGGFYYALAEGYYEEAGLDVEIIEGGPNSHSVQKVVQERVEFAMNRADTIVKHVENGLPLLIVGASLQHDPQGILMHESNPVESFKDLDGKRIMAVPGLNWIEFLRKRYGIDFTIVPHDFGMERFLSDKDFIQQCLVTNEPYYARRHGAEPKVLLLRDSGFDPYHVFYTSRSFAQKHPEIVRKFVEASVRGWQDYVTKDPSAANALIAKRNQHMTEGFMAYSRGKMIEERLVSGFSARGETTGQLDPERMQNLVQTLVELGILEEPIPLEAFMSTRFLPAWSKAKKME